MALPPDPSTISNADFQSILDRYEPGVPDKLKSLDQKRLHDVPALLSERRKTNDAHLTKDEVLTLVDWKLSHGTFRPRLRALVASNPSISSATREAFALLSPPSAPSSSSIDAALARLTKLSGVGPATASLLLSTFAPDSVPFMGDEVVRWLAWGAEGRGREGPWGRKLKYDVKEYRALVPQVREVAERLGRGVREVECVAWVLGKEAKVGGGDVKGKVAKDGGEVKGGGKRNSAKVKGEESEIEGKTGIAGREVKVTDSKKGKGEGGSRSSDGDKIIRKSEDVARSEEHETRRRSKRLKVNA